MQLLEQSLTQQIHKLYLNEQTKHYTDCELQNMEALLMVHCFHEALKVHSGEEALSLLLGSKRVYHDLSTRLLMQQSEKEFEMVVAIRQWRNIKPGFEFRAFVYNNELVACSQ